MIQRLSGLLCDATSLVEYVADIVVERMRDTVQSRRDVKIGEEITMKLKRHQRSRNRTSNRRVHDLGTFHMLNGRTRMYSDN